MKALSLDEKMIRSLLRRKREYEKYFKTEEEIDNQSTNAYTGLVKTIVELSRKAPKEVKNPEELKKLAEEILENEYGIKRQ